jgi:hypothetical protein
MLPFDLLIVISFTWDYEKNSAFILSAVFLLFRLESIMGKKL